MDLLVTLLCPNTRCLKRVAVMGYFPLSVKTIKEGDITLIDGRTAPRVDKLVCPRCFTSFPPQKAALPQYLVQAATGELQRMREQMERQAEEMPG